jgi:hypothetical protein
MDTGGTGPADTDQRCRSPDGSITADGLKLWHTVIAVGALVVAVGLARLAPSLAARPPG